MEKLKAKELVAVFSYCRINYYEATNTAKILDDGIMKLIQMYSTPFLRYEIDAQLLCDNTRQRSRKTYNGDRPSDPKSNHYKVVTLGEGAVGKTCLLITYTTNTFPVNYVPTVFDNYSASKVFNGEKIEIGLWDTAGAEDHPLLRPLSYPYTDVFLICMSVYDKREYYKENNEWTRSQINAMAFAQEAQMMNHGVVYILVGTKIDLRDDIKMSQYCWTTKQMEDLSYHCRCDAYVECSSLKQLNLNKVFKVAIGKAMENRKEYFKNKKQCHIL